MKRRVLHTFSIVAFIAVLLAPAQGAFAAGSEFILQASDRQLATGCLHGHSDDILLVHVQQQRSRELQRQSRLGLIAGLSLTKRSRVLPWQHARPTAQAGVNP